MVFEFYIFTTFSVLLVEEHGRVGREGEVVQLLREVVRRERLRRRAVAGAGAIGGDVLGS